MGWLASNNWFWVLLAALLGAAVTAFLTLRKATVVTEYRDKVAKPNLGSVGAGAAGLGAVGAVGGASLASDRWDAPEVDASADLPSEPAVDPYEAPSYAAEPETLTADNAGWAPVEPDPLSADSGYHGSHAAPLDEPSYLAEPVEPESVEPEPVEPEPVAEPAAPVAAAGVAAGAYGAGSADPLEGGASPGDAYTIKGNADSMKYHTTESPYFGRTIAEAWFDSEDSARAAGFHRWDDKSGAAGGAKGLASIPDGAYGKGSADPLDGGASPGDAYTIKGNADSMLFHTSESPYYGRTKAEVWFSTEDAARKAGFTAWNDK
jgi:hypothetical protein